MAAASAAAAAAQAGVPASMLTDHKAKKSRRGGYYMKVENALADRAKKLGISVEELEALADSIS